MINIGPNELLQLTEEIWTGMLGIAVGPVLDKTEPTTRDLSVGACVSISGAWEGAVVLQCSYSLAARATAAFLGITNGSASQEQVRDAVGELANMSAGSIKPLVPAPSHISLPSVVDGHNVSLTVPRGRPLAQACLLCGDDPLWLSVLESERQA